MLNSFGTLDTHAVCQGPKRAQSLANAGKRRIDSSNKLSASTALSASGGYSVIYTDNPWTYRDTAKAGNRGAGCKYPLLTDEDLNALPVADIAAPDCVLFSWATMPK